MRRDFEVMMHDNIKMGPGFTDEEYDVRDAAIVLEDTINKTIGNYYLINGQVNILRYN